ncbi:pumilio domain member 6 [Tulasnella sp. 330]|nr:pumilio domain member 6 [Tulasnella sp. 330]KAG8881884.1 pumilio domain member 6 [Tulasnella sp. 332]
MAPKRPSSTKQNAPPSKRFKNQFDSSKSPSHKSGGSGGGAPSKRFTKTHEPREKNPRRKAPITSRKPHRDESGTDEEEYEGFEEVPMDDDEPEEHHEDTEMVEASARESHANGNDTSTRESHQAQRQVARERRLAKPNGQIVGEAKALWELARQKSISKKEQQEHVAKLMAVVKGKIQDLVFKHDASRIVQTLVSQGSRADRDQVALELKGSYYRLSQARYSKFLVSKLIRYCPIHRPSILAEFHGKVIRSILHRETTDIIADAYELHANAIERNLLLRDFYGREVEMFDSEKVKVGGLKALLESGDGVSEEVNEARKKRIFGSMKDNLLTIFNNPDKGAVAHSIVHRVLWEYLSNIKGLASEDEQARLRQEMFDSCQELLPEMAHTRDGSRAVREFIAFGSAKDRKKIIKSFKPHLEKMCTDDQAQLVLFTCLDAVDDTKALLSSLVSEMVSLAPKFISLPSTTSSSTSTSPSESSSTAGRRSLLYLVVPRTTRHFTPAIVATLAETDTTIAKTSKKDASVRRKELRVGASSGLLGFVEQYAGGLVRDPAGSLFVGEVMLYADGDKTDATAALLEPLSCLPYPPTTDSEATSTHPIDLPHASRLYKTLIQGGHFSRSDKVIIPAPDYSAIAFARRFVEAVGEEKLLSMATHDNAAFVITELITRVMKDGTDYERKEVKRYFGGRDLRNTIWEGDAKGKDQLLGKLKELEAVQV